MITRYITPEAQISDAIVALFEAMNAVDEGTFLREMKDANAPSDGEQKGMVLDYWKKVRRLGNLGVSWEAIRAILDWDDSPENLKKHARGMIELGDQLGIPGVDNK